MAAAPCLPKLAKEGRYKGRVEVYEGLRFNEALSTAIDQGASYGCDPPTCLGSGMKTLLGYGLDLVRRGLPNPGRS